MSIPEKLEAMESAITVAQLAAVLNLGKTAIYELVRRNAILHYRLAGPRFDPQEIADWLRSRSIPGARHSRRKQ
jgi:excisionase family DNA binding protein